MARLVRLLSPGIIFASLGAVVLVAGKWPWVHLWGGLVTVGLYTLALQIVLSALLISAIDDLASSGPAIRGRRSYLGTNELLDISAQPISFSRALIAFYQRPFFPLFLLGFGLGASLSALLVGSFREDNPLAHDTLFGTLYMARSEAVLGLIMLIGAALLWWRGGRGYFGWTIGMGIAIVTGQVVFVLGTKVDETITGWGSLVIGLCLVRLLILMIMRVQRSGPSPAPDRESTRTGEKLDTQGR